MNLLQKRAFLFDLDGTLVDSSGLHEKVFQETLNQDAPHLLENFDYEQLKGKPTAQSFRELGAAEGEVLDTLVNEKQRRYRNAVLAGELRLLPGAREMLGFLHERGRRLFIVSGGSRRSVDMALYATGAHAFFEVPRTMWHAASPLPTAFFCAWGDTVFKRLMPWALRTR